jgi:hypothetical protein
MPNLMLILAVLRSVTDHSVERFLSNTCQVESGILKSPYAHQTMHRTFEGLSAAAF